MGAALALSLCILVAFAWGVAGRIRLNKNARALYKSTRTILGDRVDRCVALATLPPASDHSRLWPLCGVCVPLRIDVQRRDVVLCSPSRAPPVLRVSA